MITSRIGRLLVSSRTSRALYAAAKVVAFCYLTLYLALINATPDSPLAAWRFAHEPTLHWAGLWIVYFTVALCVIRALPVIQDGIAQVKRLRAASRG